MTDIDLPWFDSLNLVNAINHVIEDCNMHSHPKHPAWIIEPTIWHKRMQVGDDLEQYILAFKV